MRLRPPFGRGCLSSVMNARILPVVLGFGLMGCADLLWWQAPRSPTPVLLSQAGKPLVAQFGVTGPSTRLQIRPERDGSDTALTDWLRLEVRTDYRPSTWALGFAGLRVATKRPFQVSRGSFVSADVGGGAGGGPGGGPGAGMVCTSDTLLCPAQDSDGNWYDGVVYGGYFSAGASVHVGRVDFFARTRLQASQSPANPASYRFNMSIGAQVLVLGRFRIYSSFGYLVDWDEQGAIKGPAGEVGIWVPIGLFDRIEALF